jgi:hypothetical protein
MTKGETTINLLISKSILYNKTTDKKKKEKIFKEIIELNNELLIIK